MESPHGGTDSGGGGTEAVAPAVWAILVAQFLGLDSLRTSMRENRLHNSVMPISRRRFHSRCLETFRCSLIRLTGQLGSKLGRRSALCRHFSRLSQQDLLTLHR